MFISVASYSLKSSLKFCYFPVLLCIPLKFDLSLGKALLESAFVSLTIPSGNATVFPSGLADRMQSCEQKPIYHLNVY